MKFKQNNLQKNLEPDIFSDTLKVFWLCRLHPDLNPLWMAILTPVNISFCSLFAILAVKGVLVSYQNNIFYTAECLVTFILMIHIMCKQIVLHVHRTTMKNLLNQKSKFWNLSNFEGKVCNESRVILTSGRLLIRSFFYLASCAAIFFFLQPFTTHQLPTACYIPDGWFPYLTVIYWYMNYFTLLSTMGVDGLFWALGSTFTVQFKLLYSKFKTLGNQKDEVSKRELKKLVFYHNFLIDFCQKLNKMFSVVFLVQFLASIASASLAVFILMQRGPWTNRIKCLLYFVVDISEMALYCIPVEMTLNAANSIGKAVNQSYWYNIKNTKLQKSLILVVERSQKEIPFSGCGLININLQTFLLVCKTAFSFYTYLNTVQSRH